MRNSLRILAVLSVSVFAAGAAMADGFIVPIHPPHPHPRPIRFRGSWAVKYHHVDVRVRDQVASVSIDQVFVNTGEAENMEVEYFFPVPPHAAIDSMTLVVDGKELTGKLMKADEARKIYENTVRRLKDPALLEYAGFGLYKTQAFPLQKGKPAKVVVTYKDVCRKDRDLVEVWYPLNTEKFSSKPLESVKVRVDIKSEADITAVYSPTHDLDVKREDAKHVVAVYEAKDELPVTDFQVFYKAANEAVGATLMSTMPEDGKDGYFLLLVSPNPRAAADKVVAKDVVMVFDHSGSMSGEKIIQAREALAHVLKNLNADDRFNVVAYNDGVEAFYSGPVDSTEAKVADALDRLDRIDATGGTNIHDALLEAMNFPKELRGSPPPPKYIIFLTDGQPTVGKTKEADILQDVKAANKADVRLFTFGVGYDPNVRLLDKLAIEHGGRSDYVKPKEPIERKIASLYNKIKNPVMTKLQIELNNVRLKDTYPREIGDLFDGDQILLVGRYDAKDARDLPTREAGVGAAQLVVKGIYEGRQRAFEYNVGLRTADDGRYGFVEKLWAVRRIGYLLDEVQLHGQSQEVVDEIVRLSLKHGIITPYTSFLADEEMRLSRGGEVRGRALRSADRLSKSATGAEGQFDAMNRLALKEAARPAPSAMPGEAMDAAGRAAGPRAGTNYGYRTEAEYEGGKKDATVANVRQFEDQAVYRHGRVWVAANAAKFDPEQDAEKIQEVEQFSEEYFELVRQNTVGENQILASQQAGEELLIVLRDQAYRIK